MVNLTTLKPKRLGLSSVKLGMLLFSAEARDALRHVFKGGWLPVVV